MAEYKRPCAQCGSLIDRNNAFCPKCASRAPFGYRCTDCFATIAIEDEICGCCSRVLYVPCPSCKVNVFIGDKCDLCGDTLLRPCRHCGKLQFFQNKTCSYCTKK